jgi:hypothetical protein
MVVGEKNRCILVTVRTAQSPDSEPALARRQEQFQGQRWGQSAPRKSMPVVYLTFLRGEVAERLEAAVC